MGSLGTQTNAKTPSPIHEQTQIIKHTWKNSTPILIHGELRINSVWHRCICLQLLIIFHFQGSPLENLKIYITLHCNASLCFALFFSYTISLQLLNILVRMRNISALKLNHSNILVGIMEHETISSIVWMNNFFFCCSLISHIDNVWFRYLAWTYSQYSWKVSILEKKNHMSEKNTLFQLNGEWFLRVYRCAFYYPFSLFLAKLKFVLLLKWGMIVWLCVYIAVVMYRVADCVCLPAKFTHSCVLHTCIQSFTYIYMYARPKTWAQNTCTHAYTLACIIKWWRKIVLQLT